ncbi:proSAAS-like isoform X1 [Mauremys mutica]|uniref:proSAAS-like isoform X1 n=2 Tax=Mauremys mutica TaxID=74926 RepID=UPI001D16807E|nr:proSAAS-like isoform X1 [Mauremys mutica]
MAPTLMLAALLCALRPAAGKALPAGPRGALPHEAAGGPRRFRRDLRGAPYEGEMGLANEIYYPRLGPLAQDELLAQALERLGAPPAGRWREDEPGGTPWLQEAPPGGRWRQDGAQAALALQRLLQESVPLASLLQLWDQARGAPYPDYDETGAGAPPRPRAPPPPQLSRYRTDGAYENHQDEPGDEEPGEMDAEMLRYLVGRILAGGGEMRPPRHPRRLRRGLEEDPPTLLRVKRLGGDGEGPEAGAPQLQRAKRTEEEEEEAAVGGRRGAYGGEPLLRYLPE